MKIRKSISILVPMLVTILLLTLSFTWEVNSQAPPQLQANIDKPLTSNPVSIMDENLITIATGGCSPEIITVTLGTEVAWFNSTNQTHILRSGEPHEVYLPIIMRDTATSLLQNIVEPVAILGQTDGEEFGANITSGSTYTHTFNTTGIYPYYFATDFTMRGQIIVQGSALPPDPADVAPPLDRTVATDMYSATEFLFNGNPPIQTGVMPGTIDPVRIGVTRGQVLDKANNPLSGVIITVLNHPELGQTLSREDGMYDLAVNGGGLLTLNFEKAGYLPAQRQLNIPWQDFIWAPDVVLVTLDPNVTEIDLNEPVDIQVAQGGIETDEDGSRQATLLFLPGTQANMSVPRGTNSVNVPLATLSVRATEYTVGGNGPNSMPAELPDNTGYTYAVEFSVDEALEANASSVEFNQPVLFYLEDFLGFPVGSVAPNGYYDREIGQWLPALNGRVIEILRVEAGIAELDTNGDGLTDDAATLAELNIGDDERGKLAELYPQVPIVLWRVPLSHFSPMDTNWPVGCAIDETTREPACSYPEVDSPAKEIKENNYCTETGSIIECQNQILGERLPLAGSPFTLNYRSDRVEDYKVAKQLEIELIGDPLPEYSPEAIYLTIDIAGFDPFRQNVSFLPIPNYSYDFEWSGLDGYGRPWQGSRVASIGVGYEYSAVYEGLDPSKPFGDFGSGSSLQTQSREKIILWQKSVGIITNFDISGLLLGGWSLEVHHVYDPFGRTLYFGDGSRQSAHNINSVIETMAGGGGYPVPPDLGDGGPASDAKLRHPSGVAVGPDGSLYIADSGYHRIRKVSPEGIITTVAGIGTAGFSGDGGLATSAELNSPTGITIAPDETIYIADTGNNRIRRVDPDGTVETIAGNGNPGYNGDGLDALLATIWRPADVAVAPDGSIYIADSENNRIRRVGTDGKLWDISGTGSSSYSGDGGPASLAALHHPRGVFVDPDGFIFIADTFNNRVRRIGNDGIIETFAGNGVIGYSGDGSPADEASLSQPTDIVLASDGSLLMSDEGNNVIRQITADGIIWTAAGIGSAGFSGDGGPATRARLSDPWGVATTLGGDIFIGDQFNNRIRRIQPAMPGFTISDFAIPSADGQELYHFTPLGRHLRTLNTLTGALIYEFEYNGDGQLITITDAYDNVTSIERDSSGNPMAIIGPYGDQTELALDGNGYLSEMTNPANETTAFAYTTGGLLLSMTDPRLNTTTYSFDQDGLLRRVDDPVDGYKTLTRTSVENGRSVSSTTAEEHTTTYTVYQYPGSARHLVNTFPSGLSNDVVVNNDGSQIATFADGTEVTEIMGPDPRWGMQAPIVKNQSINTPDGLTYVITTSSAVELTDPEDLLSLTYLTKTSTINDKLYINIYDATTRIMTATTPAGRQSFAQIDEQGRLIWERVAGLTYGGHYTYDERGRLTTITLGPGDDPSIDRVYTISYNSQGYVDMMTDPLGDSVTFGYDAAGRVISQSFSDGRVIAYAYDDNGNMTSLTPPGRPAHTFDYTEVNLQETYTPPIVSGIPNPETEYTYNLDREIELMTRPDGLTIDPEYDGTTGRLSHINLPNGQIIQLNYFDGEGGEANTGQVETITVVPDDVSLAYTYDASLMTAETWSGPITGTVGHAYDDDLLLASLTVNGAGFFQVDYGYDDDGLLSSATANMPGEALTAEMLISRDPNNGLLTGTSLGNITTDQTYNEFGELASYTASYNGVPIFGTTYVRDDLGRIVDLTETLDGATTLTHYEYDTAGRLTEVWENGVHVSHYEYDANGNRLAHTNPSTGGGITPDQVVHDNQDRLLQYGNTSYTYTANGELLTQTENGETTTYEYDVLGNLKAVTLPDGTEIEYFIDGQNRRIGKKADGILVQGYLYKDWLNPVAELDGEGNVVSIFAYSSRINVPDYMISRKADGVNWVVYRVIADHLGSPRLVSNVMTNEIVQKIRYDEFGNIVTELGGGFQPFGFAGGIYDENTELIRFGARDYDAIAGRWSSKEPRLFLDKYPNRYMYNGGDPVNFLDPLGLQPQLNLFDSDLSPTYWGYGNSIKPRKGEFTVAGHGTNREGFIAGGTFSHMSMNAKRFLKSLEFDNAWEKYAEQTDEEKRIIRLWMCKAGKGSNSFAKQLYEISGMTVWAPTGDTVYDTNQDPIYGIEGKWVCFGPGCR